MVKNRIFDAIHYIVLVCKADSFDCSFLATVGTLDSASIIFKVQGGNNICN